MKNMIKKWWFWLIILIIVIVLFNLCKSFLHKKQLEDSLANVGQGVADFIDGIDTAQSHLNDFSYNYEIEEVEYEPSQITLDMYNKIEEKMTQEEILFILGIYDNKIEGENTYILEWENSYSPIHNGYWIQIVFDDNNKTVLNKSQVGLK